MTSFEVKILTPQCEVVNCKADKLVVRTTEGDVGIFANHINYVAVLGNGKLSLTENSQKKTALANGGFITVSNGKVTVLTDFFEWE